MGEKLPWFVVFADFCGVITLILVNFNLQMSRHWTWIWEEMLPVDPSTARRLTSKDCKLCTPLPSCFPKGFANERHSRRGPSLFCSLQQPMVWRWHVYVFTWGLAWLFLLSITQQGCGQHHCPGILDLWEFLQWLCCQIKYRMFSYIWISEKCCLIFKYKCILNSAWDIVIH